MAVKQVRAQINGTWTTLTLNSTSGKYEATIAAPGITSFNQSGGFYAVTVEATDLAGNTASKTTADATLGSNLKLYVKEKVVPTISITSPSAGAFLTTNTPAIVAQVKDETNGSGIKISSLVFKVDGTTYTNTSSQIAVAAITGGYTVTFTPTVALTDGAHTISIDIEDNDGNKATQVTRSFTVDTVPPTLTVSNPSDSVTHTNNATLSLQGTTSDSTSGAATVTITLNGASQGTVTVESNGTFTKALTLAQGENTIVVKATDKAGKSSEVTRKVNLDTAAPVISSITITPNPVNTGASYTISIQVTD